MSSIGSIHVASASGYEAFANRTQRSNAAAPTQEELFASIDSDADGQLSEAEFGAVLQAASPQGFDQGAMSTQGFAEIRAAGPRPPPPPEGGADPVASLDSDASGSVSAEEFGLDGASASMQAMFAAIDGDGNGELSTDETDAFRSAMQQAIGGTERPPPGAANTAAATDAGSGEADAIREELLDFLQKMSEMFVGLYADIAGDPAAAATSTL